MDLYNQLIQAFDLSINPKNQDDIKQAEQFLENAKKLPKFVVSLMMLIDNKDVSINIRQAAAINLKNTVEKHWDNPFSKDKFVISQEDKATLRESILNATIRSVDEPKISVLYEKVVYKILQCDYPNQTPNLLENILGRLSQAKDFNEFYGSILFIKNLVSIYEFLLDTDRKPLNIIIPYIFPTLEKYATDFLQTYNDQTAITMNAILKAFHSAIHLELPSYFANEKVLHTWLVFLKTILDSPTPPEIEVPTNDWEEALKREKNVYCKNKKWCGRILQRFIQKYGNPKFENKEHMGLANLFQEKYSVFFLESFVTLLLKRKTCFVPSKLTHFALKYVYYSLRLEKTMATLHPHLEKIMFEVLISLVCLTPRDEYLWNNDPDEYVKKEEDFTQISINNKNVAIDLIEEICKKSDPSNRSYLELYFTYASYCLINQIDPRTKEQVNLISKEALMYIFGTLKEEIIKNEALKPQMEKILEQHVLTEFKNPIGFLRARACWLFGKFGHLEFQNPNNIKVAVEGITNCLMDANLPVRVKAAVALNCLLLQKEAEDLLRPLLPKILEIYLKLMDQIDNEGIVAALEGIVDSYQNEIVPYAYDLIIHLVNAFHKYCNKTTNAAKDDDEDNDESEAELAAVGCLEAIRRILQAKLPETTYSTLQVVLVPVFNYCFSEDGSDFIDEALNCLNIILYNSKSVDSTLLIYYPILCYIIIGIPETTDLNLLLQAGKINEEQLSILEKVRNGWGAEFIEAMLGCFKNYMAKTNGLFLTYSDFFGTSFVELLFKTINRVYEISLNGSDDLDMVLVSTLYISFIENHIEKIDNYIPMILDNCLNYLKIDKSKQFKVILIEVISIALYYNAGLVLNHLNTNPDVLISLFQAWFGLLPHFKNDFDKIRVLFGLASILKLPQQYIPQSLMGSMGALLKQIIKLTTEILQLREEEESIKDEAEEEGDAIENKNEEIDDEDDEDDEDEDFEFSDRANLLYISPLEHIDEIIYFKKILETLSQTQPSFYEFLMHDVTIEEKQTLLKNFENAEIQYAEYIKTKDQPKEN